jgi:hypothetical protein
MRKSSDVAKCNAGLADPETPGTMASHGADLEISWPNVTGRVQIAE